MEIRELVIIVLVSAAGSGFIWYETGRDPLLLKTIIALIAIFLFGGAIATAIT